MFEWMRGRAEIILIALFVAALAVGAVLIAGNQTSTILSRVGGPIGGAGADPGGTRAPEASAPASTTGTAEGGRAGPAGAEIPTLLIVRTGTLELVVTDLAEAIAAADSAVTRAGGYVSASTRTAGTDDSSAQATYRIPSAAWDRTLAVLHARAEEVKAEEIKTEEVTGQVVDLTARISNLHATEAALQAIMGRATKIRDVLEVQAQLTTTRGEIEQLVAQKDTLADRASFGSLGVTFSLPVRPKPTVTPAPTKGWDPGTDVAGATGKLVRIGQRATSAGIWLAIVGLPVVIGGTILLVLGWQVFRLGRWTLGRRSRTAPGDEPLGA
jgi:uncharacterized protein DUF4349